jgi:hypothetical protein
MEGLPARYFVLSEARPPGVFFVKEITMIDFKKVCDQWPIGLARSSCGRDIQRWPARLA